MAKHDIFKIIFNINNIIFGFRFSDIQEKAMMGMNIIPSISWKSLIQLR